MFKGVSNSLQNFTLMGAIVFEIAGGCPVNPPLVKGVGIGTKRLGKGRVNGSLRQKLRRRLKMMAVIPRTDFIQVQFAFTPKKIFWFI